ncbi:MAG: hypothetical protein A2381_03395 [Bdellovibrionales bacterium RIFOXYB1_FULL_37_110]|nr:MAG: hypothetical protein A2181_00500 [Bdellovibrionales bacterium RIFOXYA1_FULL_38_20]OFZ48450.1 MAG: hypothetical protein A2417_03885 [Bdellovibrionales bacterium RIFOXYC1_FULL_37_79]OFZ57971.1 MAG: hypothetical protein A2381_03395 [Bdellovibrionales bacterium RIFOXYB1_FULL_37_110]OFZ63108.1 MAG: hypothetical protein A2577_15525 [Bdellovibrionales bacterium RIFOXYD1_FULL_36_51]
MKNIIIEVDKLNFTYEHLDKNVLENISFKICENEFVGIIGPNGGGKTTLVKILLGLLSPQSGSVQIFGTKPGKNPHKIAYLPQHLVFDPQIPITVEEVVLMGCLGHRFIGLYTQKDHQNAIEAMTKMNVIEYQNAFFSSLSGGQKQRVLIARALTCRPKILILDEPSAGIDTHHEQILLDLLKKLNAEMSIIMVSHEYQFVSSLVDYVICINKDSHIHYPNEINEKNFQEIISKKYQYIAHDHEVKTK